MRGLGKETEKADSYLTKDQGWEDQTESCLTQDQSSPNDQWVWLTPAAGTAGIIYGRITQ